MRISTNELNTLIDDLPSTTLNKIVDKYYPQGTFQKCEYCDRYILGLVCGCNKAQESFLKVIKELEEIKDEEV